MNVRTFIPGRAYIVRYQGQRMIVLAKSGCAALIAALDVYFKERP